MALTQFIPPTRAEMKFCESSHHEAHPDTATGAARSAPDVHTLVDSRYRLHAHPSSLIGSSGV